MGETPLEGADEAPEDGKTQVATRKARTPVYTAQQGMRYLRQGLIRQIERETGAQLICYVGGAATSIRRDDVLFLADLLHNLERGKPIDLMLHTSGGDMDAAEKMVAMIHATAGTAAFRVIVPDFAKSAGTLMALGANSIVMSDTSELGPIDPQVVIDDKRGTTTSTAVQACLDSFEHFSAAFNKDPSDAAAKLMLDKFDPTRLHHYIAAKERARTLAEKFLQLRMFPLGSGGNYTAIASRLMDTKAYRSHSQMIDVLEAKRLKLRIEQVPTDDPTWQMIWQLYCYQRFEASDRFKVFESNFVSLHHEDAG